MATKAGGFIISWAITTVPASGHKAEGDLAEAGVLADKCVALAAAQGITRADLEAEVGDLREHLRKAQNIAEAAKGGAH